MNEPGTQLLSPGQGASPARRAVPGSIHKMLASRLPYGLPVNARARLDNTPKPYGWGGSPKGSHEPVAIVGNRRFQVGDEQHGRDARQRRHSSMRRRASVAMA